MLSDRGKEYVRCYKYETENALVLMLAFYTPGGVVKYWLMIHREELVGGNSTVGQAGKHLCPTRENVCAYTSPGLYREMISTQRSTGKAWVQ